MKSYQNFVTGARSSYMGNKDAIEMGATVVLQRLTINHMARGYRLSSHFVEGWEVTYAQVEIKKMEMHELI